MLVVDAVGRTPVIAAGGIADGRGVAAALALGAAGVWMGTRFLASEEAAVDDSYKDRVVAASEADTLYSTLFDDGWPDAPHRVLENSTVEDWKAAGRPPSGERPGEGERVAALPDGTPVVRYSDVIPLPGMTGDLEALALYAGQSAGLVDAVKPAADIVADLARETLAAIRALKT
jgi:nitronate monooxygenase